MNEKGPYGWAGAHPLLGSPPGDGPGLLQSCRDVCSVTTALLSLLGKCKGVAHSQLSILAPV